FFQAEDGIRDFHVTGVQTCALPISKDGKRTVSNVLLIVNPLDYWSKIFPGTTVLTANGTYVYGVLPIPAKVVQSVAAPEGKLIEIGRASCREREHTWVERAACEHN